MKMATAVDSKPDIPEKQNDFHGALAQFGEDLRKLRKESGLSWRELAGRTHYARSSLSAAASGIRLPTRSLTLALVKACGGPVEEWDHRWADLRNQADRTEETGSPSAGTAIDLRPEQVSTRIEFLAALRTLHQASGLSYGGLERASGGQLSRSTLSDMLTGRTMPTWPTTRSFVSACMPASPILTSLDSGPWHLAWERVRALDVEQPAHALKRTPVQECDPYELGVHQAYSLRGAPEPPAYVHRDTEGELQRALMNARNRNGFILLIGQSGAGKTRLAYEMMQRTLRDFGLLHPAGTDELGAVPPPRTVVWLDDMDQYLRSGLTRSMLQALLGGPRPVVVLGTIWPSQYHAYMTLPQPGGQDIHQREREVLNLATVIDVKAGLSPSELDSARAAARDDPRIAAAMNSSDHGIFQNMAAGPHLMRRWNNAGDVYAEALITAAINARRTGAWDPLDIDQLREAVWAQLSATQKAQAPRDWLEKALSYATAPVPGGIAVLTPTSGTTGTAPANGYHVADFLVQCQDLPVSMQQSTKMPAALVVRGPAAEDWHADRTLVGLMVMRGYLAVLCIRADVDNWQGVHLPAELLARHSDPQKLCVRVSDWHAAAQLARLLGERDDLQIIWWTI
jgi:transcriptional regulator with XRE-family HTH domain